MNDTTQRYRYSTEDDMKAWNLHKRVQLYRGVTWDQFGQAWSERPPETADKPLNALRLFGLMILW